MPGGYDATKDKLIYESDPVWQDEYSQLTIAIYKYENGVPKLAVLKRDKKDLNKSRPPGRWTAEQASVLIPALSSGLIKLKNISEVPDISVPTSAQTGENGDIAI